MYNTELPTRAELPSSRQLIRSTLIAAVAASTLLTTTVLPAEYGIDPTGIGSLLGLKKMGEIKTSLASEAAQQTPDGLAPVATEPASNAQAGAAVVESKSSGKHAGAKVDEISVVLKPGESAEVKLEMRKGAKVAYRWTVRGGNVNFDTHGDPVSPPAGFYHGYGKGREAGGDKGVLEAAFDGKHGWFWRNRSGQDVNVTLSTQGEYKAIKRVL
jgi:hypothetical protein